MTNKKQFNKQKPNWRCSSCFLFLSVGHSFSLFTGTKIKFHVSSFRQEEEVRKEAKSNTEDNGQTRKKVARRNMNNATAATAPERPPRWTSENHKYPPQGLPYNTRSPRGSPQRPLVYTAAPTMACLQYSHLTRFFSEELVVIPIKSLPFGTKLCPTFPPLPKLRKEAEECAACSMPSFTTG